MHMTDTLTISAPPTVVWSALMDAGVLKLCVPGCEELTGTPETGFEAAVVQKVGPVKARFTGTVSFSEVIEGQSLILTGEGKGGAAGFAKGSAHVRLSPVTLDDGGEGTALAYEVEARVGGKLAQLGSRIIDGFARKMADDFFARFKEAVEGPADADTPDAAADDSGNPDEAPKKGWFRRVLRRD